MGHRMLLTELFPERLLPSLP